MIKPILNIAGIPVFWDTTENRYFFVAGMMIDGDGSPNCYKPDNSGLDDLCEARDGEGGWCGIVTLDKARKVPYVTPDGNYVSQTEYQWKGQPLTSPSRYVDSEKVAFFVVPPQLRLFPKEIVLGCKGRITYNGIVIDAGVLDIGPPTRLGEASIHAADLVHIPSSPRTGGITDREVAYEFWPGVPAVLNGVEYELQPKLKDNQ